MSYTSDNFLLEQQAQQELLENSQDYSEYLTLCEENGIYPMSELEYNANQFIVEPDYPDF